MRRELRLDELHIPVEAATDQRKAKIRDIEAHIAFCQEALNYCERTDDWPGAAFHEDAIERCEDAIRDLKRKRSAK